MAIISSHNLLHNLFFLTGGFLFLSAITIIVLAKQLNASETRLHFFLNGVWNKVHSLELALLLPYGSQTMYKWQQKITALLLFKANKIRLTNIAIVSIIVVFFPIASLINALTGGSHFLLNVYLSLAVIFAILMITGEIKQLNLFNQLLSFISCFGILVFVPIYVARSFTHTILTNGFYQSFLLSFVVAIFWYVAVFCLWQFIEFVLPKTRSTETFSIRLLAPFLCVFPAALILTFTGLYLGQMSTDYVTPPRSWTLLLSSVTGLGLSYVVSYNITLRIKSYIISILTCLVLSILISFFVYYIGFKTSVLKNFITTFFGFNPFGNGVQLTPQFWVIHLPQIPVMIYITGLSVIALMKLVDLSKLSHRLPTIHIPTPFYSTAVVLLLLAIPQLIIAFYY